VVRPISLFYTSAEQTATAPNVINFDAVGVLPNVMNIFNVSSLKTSDAYGYLRFVNGRFAAFPMGKVILAQTVLHAIPARTPSLSSYLPFTLLSINSELLF
jgi:hypothetical protein